MKYFYASRNPPSFAKPEEFSLPPHFYISDQDQSPPSFPPVSRLHRESPSTSCRDALNSDSKSKCLECGKEFETKKAMYGHMRIHRNRGLKGTPKRPSVSKWRFEFESYTDRLLSNSWGATRKRVRKPVIDMNSQEAVAAAFILMEMSRSKSNGSYQNKKRKTMESDPLDEKKHAGENCNRSFPSDQALVEHRSSHKNERKNEAIQESTEVLKIGEEQKSPKRRKVKSESGSHVCEICNKSYPTGQQLGGHKRAHYKKDLTPISEVPNGEAALGS
ncbi:zinc finger protein ZAT9-like protein [Carex littledalei]|uniref:Zinc finger protein ZAT9-like protein n=1 Tax=Carex littledalei TaxID=544730 RepID=A0A833VBG0_9POAL|nr:zinc finger protein ZAT9-like protein [Carex littledalei]